MVISAAQEQEAIKRARGEIEKRTGKTPEQLYEEREKRTTDIIQLRVPDSIPVFLRLGDFPMRYGDLSPAAMFYDFVAYRQAVLKTLLYLDPDIVQLRNVTMPSGNALEILGSVQNKWPGGNLRPDQLPQHRDAEIMKEDEYDLFLADPGDYVLRYYLPRTWKSLEPLSKLPPLRSLVGYVSMATQAIRFNAPEIIRAFEAIFKAGQEEEKFGQFKLKELTDSLGIIPKTYSGGGVTTPFDTITDNFRGMRGVAVDMYKQPEKLLAAMDKVLEWQRATVLPAAPKEWGRRRVSGGMSHWGAQAFLSRKQFYTFYWPTLKKSLLAAIDMGYIPVPYPEGNHDDRIECLLELPKGKVLVHTNLTNDIFRMKEILGGHVAFMGGVPPALLHFGSPQEVDECCKKLIEVCGKGGGYILSAAAVGEDEAKPENLKAMVDAVRKYGRY